MAQGCGDGAKKINSTPMMTIRAPFGGGAMCPRPSPDGGGAAVAPPDGGGAAVAAPRHRRDCQYSQRHRRAISRAILSAVAGEFIQPASNALQQTSEWDSQGRA